MYQTIIKHDTTWTTAFMYGIPIANGVKERWKSVCVLGVRCGVALIVPGGTLSAEDVICRARCSLYEELRQQRREEGWDCWVLPVEVGCRGFLDCSKARFLSQLGCRSPASRRVIREIQQAAEAASLWIWHNSQCPRGL